MFPIIWATFVRKIVTKTFQKYSNPVTLQFYGTIFFYLPMLLLKLTENYDKF